MSNLLDGVVRFEGVKGVGTIELDFVPNQRVYTFIGANGVGKTKLLECLFTVLCLTSKYIGYVELDTSWFNKMKIEKLYPNNISVGEWDSAVEKLNYSHVCPIVYMGAHNRGYLSPNRYNSDSRMKSFGQRRQNYISLLLSAENFKSLNRDIREWIIECARSVNPYQAKADNRKIELDTLLFILNQIDERIDGEFLEISGDNRVFVKVEEQKRELAELSSGFTSVLKMVQSIIEGYSCFTNEQQIARVRGVVLIDEIESHLHNEWQVKIIPLLKKLFPNTTFLITTHSSLVISQLEQGEAYRLERDKNDGVVYGKLIDYPSNASLVDLLNEAFNVDLNKLKIERTKESNQTQAKQALLALVQQELAKLETK